MEVFKAACEIKRTFFEAALLWGGGSHLPSQHPCDSDRDPYELLAPCERVRWEKSQSLSYRFCFRSSQAPLSRMQIAGKAELPCCQGNTFLFCNAPWGPSRARQTTLCKTFSFFASSFIISKVHFALDLTPWKAQETPVGSWELLASLFFVPYTGRNQPGHWASQPIWLIWTSNFEGPAASNFSCVTEIENPVVFLKSLQHSWGTKEKRKGGIGGYRGIHHMGRHDRVFQF